MVTTLIVFGLKTMERIYQSDYNSDCTFLTLGIASGADGE